MKHVLNIGSLNIDHVYQVDHFVQPGETLASLDYKLFAGGKGFNQSVALARAGLRVSHAGKVGRDGSVPHALRVGNRAAAISVTRPGAADSIPSRDEVVTH